MMLTKNLCFWKMKNPLKYALIHIFQYTKSSTIPLLQLRGFKFFHLFASTFGMSLFQALTKFPRD